MKWFSSKEPEIIYFGVRIERIFERVASVARVKGETLTDAQRRGRFDEDIFYFELRERHQHLPRGESVEIWRKLIEREVAGQFPSNCWIKAWESDVDGYLHWHEKITDIRCMVEQRFR